MFYDPVYKIQPDTCSLPYILSREKRVEYPRHNLFRNPSAIVDYFHFYIFAVTRCFYGQLTVLVNSINSIVDNICPYLVQLADISRNIHKVLAISFVYCYIFFPDLISQ